MKIIFSLLLLAVCVLANALVDVALDREYYVDPPGFSELIFQSYGGQAYEHVSIYDASPNLLTLSLPVSAAPLLWTNATSDFNATITIYLGNPSEIKEVTIKGPCCNLGIYTPIAAYVSGSLSPSGPWTLLGKTTGLISGDEIDTPAVRYQMHFATAPGSGSWSYVQVKVTGAAGKYMSVRTIQLWA